MPDTKQHIRAEILDTAKQYITKDRQATHGKPEDSFQSIAEFWTAHLRGRGKLDVLEVLDRIDVAAMLAGMKLARASANPDHIDNWIDLAGYAGCGGEIATLQNQQHDIATPVNTAQEYWKASANDLDRIHGMAVSLSKMRTELFDDKQRALLIHGMTRPDTLSFEEYRLLEGVYTTYFI